VFIVYKNRLWGLEMAKRKALGFFMWLIGGLAGLSGFCVVGGLIAFALNPVLMGRYYAVVVGSDTVNRVDTLAPLEVLKGQAGPALEITQASALSDAAKAQAIELATKTTSQSLLVWAQGGLALEHYGAGFDRDSVSNTASMMKPVLALGVGAAIDRGLMKLTDPVGLYIPQWKNDPRGEITIEQLLTMTSGLAHAPFSLNPYSRYMTSWLSEDINKIALESQLVVPATRDFQYSNINYQVLAIALEGATKKRLADWLSETIWMPIAAKDAQLWLDKEEGTSHAFCCLLARAQDWLAVALLIKNDGKVGTTQVISKAWIDAMKAPSAGYANFGYGLWRASPATSARSYGAGISFKVPAKEAFLAPDTVYFDGNGGQRIYISVKQDLIVQRIGAPKMDWDDSQLPNIIAAGLVTTAK
jgi:CubicO group peptidase (beta-lactamase class C family)